MSKAFEKPILKSVFDKWEKGIVKGQTFYQIFRFSYSYLEWIIRETEICFQDLDDFFKYGKPVDISKFKKEQLEALFCHVKENNKKSKSGGILIHYDNFFYLKKVGLITFSELIEMPYKFPEELKEINLYKVNKLNLKQ